MSYEVPKCFIYLVLTVFIFRLTIAKQISENMYRTAPYEHEEPIVSARQQYENNIHYNPFSGLWYKPANFHGLVDSMLRQRPTRGFDIEAICRKGIAFGSWIKDFCKTKRFHSG